MKRALLFIVCILFITIANGQNQFKNITDKPHDPPGPIHVAKDLPSLSCDARKSQGLNIYHNTALQISNQSIESFRYSSSGSIYIELNGNDLWQSRNSVNDIIGELIPNSVNEGDWSMEWKEVSREIDQKNFTHIRVQQLLAGHPIVGQDMVLHIAGNQLRDINGFAWTAGIPQKLPAPVSEEDAFNAAKKYLKEKGIPFQKLPQLEGLTLPKNEIQLTWIPQSGKLILAYEVSIFPNMLDHWTLYINAGSLDLIKSYSQRCSIFPEQLYQDCGKNVSVKNWDFNTQNSSVISSNEGPGFLGDGPTVTTDQDLLGQNRTVHAYLVGSNFFMIDASRTSMFDPVQSVIPNEPLGVIWTIDGQNGSPQKENFEVIHVTNTTNNWKNLEVSAHYNAGEAFEYFRSKFNRISLNGSGGNIISIINVADENGGGLDNAFWSGTAMFYGNGDVAFQPLAKALDVAGHEMSHGVVQNTANLEYIGQSGALNESYADVFGTLIDRDDWRIGEDVVNLNFFPSGALRDLSNPHNGGTNANDPSWQPAHMNEYQNLPNTPDGDNGGVHVNSGIPNRAYFLFASSVGKEKAEQVYYKALRDYLVKSSQFIDMRIAVEKAATDLYGANSPEVTASHSAFDAVGIGSGQGGDYEDDIELNQGQDFIIATDENESDLYWVPPSNLDQIVKLELPAPISRPSFTDDGSACVYVDSENNMIVIYFDWSQGLSYHAFYLEDSPQGLWRNIAVSKDGTKIAYTTASLTNEIFVYDFNSDASKEYFLFNPTTAEGQYTGDVLYPDALEWDYSGQYVMYDALNRIESNFGDGIEYWDISFLFAWDNVAETFTEGQIGKLFTSLPENVSVGNPSFAKNSPYIVTFDYLEVIRDGFGNETDDYRILASNIEEGYVNEIFHNTTIGYPNYSKLDDKILFTYDNFGSLLLATIDIQVNDKTLPVQGSDVPFITGAQKGVWFATGSRDFTGVKQVDASSQSISVWPQPASNFITMDLNNDVDYQIFDLSGRMVQTGALGSNQALDIASLSPGSYLLSLNAGEKYFKARFVKQ